MPKFHAINSVLHATNSTCETCVTCKKEEACTGKRQRAKGQVHKAQSCQEYVMHHDVHGRTCSGHRQNDMHGENDTKPPHTVLGRGIAKAPKVWKSVSVGRYRGHSVRGA